MKFRLTAVIGLCVCMALSVWMLTVVRSFPAQLRIFNGEEIQLDVGRLFTLDHPPTLPSNSGPDPTIVEIRLLGRFTVKTAVVDVVREVFVVPGGQAIGVFYNDAAAGIGTLSFWDPLSKRYGALGHQIAVNEPSGAFADGKIMAAHIHGIQPGVRGKPGEKIGVFASPSHMGVIERNTAFGIFGTLTRAPGSPVSTIPVALARDVRTGDATMLTVLDGEEVESFSIDVTAVHHTGQVSGKGLIIEVTDPKLLARTNGIVQGMSGSPIVQDGKLIGVVTHVFVNDSRRGYGILAEWMVYEAGIAQQISRSPVAVGESWI